ncbi:MAG: DUF1998 domain-containing protein, partial [Armatimonadetes bacterium]|nr:DUF1998 domain-containing protein [Armatimonadota bacterium]
AGRGTDKSLAVLVARSTPIDQYLMEHPEYFFDQSHERAVIDPQNPYVLAAHLRCAMHELPLDGSDEQLFGPLTAGIVRVLAEEKEAVEYNGRWFWTGPSYPANDVALRSADADNYVIQDVTDGEPRVVGMLDEWSAFTLVHDEAVYLHEGDTYFVERLDTQNRVATVVRKQLDYYTVAIDKTRVRLLREPDEPVQERCIPRGRVGLGMAEVTSSVFMFKKIKFYRNESIGYGSVRLPEHTLLTKAVYIAPAAAVLAGVQQAGLDVMEGMLGASNAVAGVLPPLISCDPGDVGAVVDSANLGVPAIFMYDRYPGGVGYAERAFEQAEGLLAAALELVERCPCESGCPSCVGPPPPMMSMGEDIDTRGASPDKRATIALLRAFVFGELPERRADARLASPSPAAIGHEEEAGAEHVGAAPTGAAEGNAPPLLPGSLPRAVEKEIRKRIARWRESRAKHGGAQDYTRNNG